MRRRSTSCARRSSPSEPSSSAALGGAAALHLVGDEIGLAPSPLPELGLVGDPVPSCPPAVVVALERGRIPVVTPIAVGPLNVNADEAASALAVGIGADRIVFVSDVPGVYRRGRCRAAPARGSGE